MRTVIGMVVLAVAISGCTARAPVKMTAARAAAIHDCSIAAAKFSYTSTKVRKS
jgi:hypothetical protein